MMRILRLIINSIFGLAISVIFSAICLVWGFTPEKWLGALFTNPPAWLFHPLVRLVAAAIGGFAALAILLCQRKPKFDVSQAQIHRLTQTLRDREPEVLQRSEVPKEFGGKYLHLSELSLSSKEHGSWTPILNMSDEGDSVTTNYEKLIGRYWSDGDVCRTEAEIVFTPNCPDDRGTIEISGFPFLSRSGPRHVIGVYEKIVDGRIEIIPMKFDRNCLIAKDVRLESGAAYIISFSATYSI